MASDLRLAEKSGINDREGNDERVWLLELGGSFSVKFLYSSFIDDNRVLNKYFCSTIWK